MAKEAKRSSAPQEQSDWTAAVGVSKLVPLKMNNTALDLALSFSSLFNVLARGRSGSFGRVGHSP